MSRFHHQCPQCGEANGFGTNPTGRCMRCAYCGKASRVPGSRGFFGAVIDFLDQLQPSTPDRCARCGSNIPRYAPACWACGRDQPRSGDLFDPPPGAKG